MLNYDLRDMKKDIIIQIKSYEFAINKHLSNMFESSELVENSVISILEASASDSKIYKTKF